MIHGRTFDARFASRFLELLTPTRFVFYGAPSKEVIDGAAPLVNLFRRIEAPAPSPSPFRREADSPLQAIPNDRGFVHQGILRGQGSGA